MKTSVKKNLIILFLFIGVVFFTISLILIEPEKEDTQQMRAPLQSEKNENIVFLGDSITEWYAYDFYYKKGMPIINSGKAGYSSKTLLSQLVNMVYIYNPTTVIVLIGTNDMNIPTYNRNETLSNIENIIKSIKENRPHSKIYVQSIYPINTSDDEKIDPITVGIRDNEEILTVNDEIKKIAGREKVEYIDMHSELVDEKGELNIYYTKDGLHLNELGYYIVTKKINHILENE